MLVPGTVRSEPRQKHLPAPLTRVEGALVHVAEKYAEQGKTDIAEALREVAAELHHWL